LAAGQPVKIVLGSNDMGQPGWILTDKADLDVTTPASWAAFVPAASADNLLAEHVFEHLTPDGAKIAAQQSFRHLKHGGRFRIAVPDGNSPDPNYIEHVRVGGSGPGAADHKVLYTLDSLTGLFANAGFKVDPLEYFDAGGRFHSIDWADEDGHIMPSRRYDRRNSDGQLRYTSLIIDALKL
jgi:predicted SAM-dependent methyltransferase